MNTKLIIVEGLPGSGKTTTASLIYEMLTNQNINTELFLEGNLDHPADYDGVACFSEKEFNELLSLSGDFRQVFNEVVIKRENQNLLPFGKILRQYGSKLPENLLHNIFKKDIYELPFERNMELITEKWSEFVGSAMNENKTYIFECCFIQNPVTIGMVKYGEEKEKVMDYVSRLAKIIEGLNPVLFYVEQDDIESSFMKAVEERPKEWSTGFIDYYTTQGYGKLLGYEGLKGTLNVLKARRDVEREIFDKLRIRKEKVNNSEFDMENYKSMIKEKLILKLERGTN